jgi:hypothetical protein
MEALAGKPALQIGEADEDGVDLAGFGKGAELVEGQHAWHGRTRNRGVDEVRKSGCPH